jgi:hypothetical protein
MVVLRPLVRLLGPTGAGKSSVSIPAILLSPPKAVITRLAVYL